MDQWAHDRRDACRLREQEGAIAPIYSIAEIVEDPQYLARETVTSVPHPPLGPPLMQNVIPRLIATPGRIGHAGAALREHNVEILCGELDVTEEELASLTVDGVVADVPAPVPSTGEDAE
jgi:crotonobetainyl-CoA:carnitine CoA-transferase CaiB-like acyl-CoA transferase